MYHQMFSSIKSIALSGINGVVANVEADVRNGLPGFVMVGFLSTQVRESGERVRSAISNSGFRMEPKRILINFSPADIRKEGTTFDLAVAIAILTAEMDLTVRGIEDTAFIGELSLSGSLKSVNGVLPMVCIAKEAGIKRVILPKENYREAHLVEGIEILPAESLSDVMQLVLRKKEAEFPAESDLSFQAEEKLRDFSEIHGQENVKRAIEISVSGMHNILMVGPAGSGKSLLASCISSIMPPLTADESLETTKIYSISGLLCPEKGLINKRPFRSPHNSISVAALVGGGNRIRPGEISLAHNGVLFLDELPEFNRQTIEILRQPLEEKKITVARVRGVITYPSDFLLAGAMNPCKCGFYPDRKLCRCDENQIRKYLSRVSRPMIDRFDMVTEASRVEYKHIAKKGGKEEKSEEIRKRVLQVREIQEERFHGRGIHFNSQMDNEMVGEFCRLEEKARKMLETAYERHNMSLRGYYRVLKLSRTIADMERKKDVSEAEIAEAIHYREMAERFWGR